jgi:DHA1 family bicyclomycin/chloramphenicol resistance-like MFS transporter
VGLAFDTVAPAAARRWHDTADTRPGAGDPQFRSQARPGSWTEALAGGRLFFYLATLTATQIGIYAFISASPYIVVDLLGRSATEYGLFFVVLTLGFLSGNFLSTRIAHRLGTDRTIVLGLLVYAAAWTVLAWSLLRGQWNAVALFAPGTVLACCNGLVQPNCHAAAMNGAGDAKGTPPA